ncbi:MAG: hypothetical protein KJZ78_29135, partial [Bryobacteraceae bacterium]|nr:hypothetical protein [Bryobacteraceae bacterium]
LLVPATCLGQDAAARQTAKQPYRQIVGGVFKTVPADIRASEATSTHDVVELLANTPNIGWKPKLYPYTRTLEEMATDTTFRRTIFGLEFTFKAPRMIWVDMPLPGGKMQRKLIWYLLYKVKNPGGQIRTVPQADGTFTVETVNEPVRFEPLFVLESLEYKKAYLDRLIPVAVEAIRKREDPARPLLNSVEIAAREIPVSTEREDHSVWGVATWEDIDPRVDYFAIYVEGLSNAYKWLDPKGAYQKGDPAGKGRLFANKTLRLNFWRPGDVLVEDQREIRYGIPGKVDYEWIYR